MEASFLAHGRRQTRHCGSACDNPGCCCPCPYRLPGSIAAAARLAVKTGYYSQPETAQPAIIWPGFNAVAASFQDNLSPRADERKDRNVKQTLRASRVEPHTKRKVTARWKERQTSHSTLHGLQARYRLRIAWTQGLHCLHQPMHSARPGLACTLRRSIPGQRLDMCPSSHFLAFCAGLTAPLDPWICPPSTPMASGSTPAFREFIPPTSSSSTTTTMDVS